jgi:hypothetical protein
MCICGQFKFKHCHLSTVTKLIQFGQHQLKMDLALFVIDSNEKK